MPASTMPNNVYKIMEKEKQARKLVLRTTPWIFLLVLPLLYLHVKWGSRIQLEQRFHNFMGSRKVFLFNTTVQEKQESLDFVLSRLMQGEELEKMMETGFACSTQVYSKHCVANHPLQIDTRTMTLIIPSNQSVEETIIRPYARQEDHILLKTVAPVKVLHGITTSPPPPLCQYNHRIPAVIFSSSGFIGNIFHEINEIIIPLFITTSLFKSRVQFILEDYRPSFVRKYKKVISRLTSHEIINPNSNRTVHCFPGAVIGLKFHSHLALNSSDVPTGLSMLNFKQFLRESLNLKYNHISQIKQPTVLLLSRTTTRRILNEDDVVAMMEGLGFRVVVVRRAKVIANLEVFSSMINACSVLLGAHGAGLTNEVFLPDGAVMVQLDLIGLEWAARTYYGDPARGMRVKYLRYRIEAEESSLMKVFGSKNHTAIVNPEGAFPLQAGREVYLNGQNVRINIGRFRETMIEAMSLVQHTPL
ncbi:hypothetical protein ACS0TY_032687 [Phlomoides rotata]